MAKKMTGNSFTEDRPLADNYATYFSMTRRLFDFNDFNFDLSVSEPAAGEGAMVKVLKDVFSNVLASDKYSYVNKYCPEVSILQRDFILESSPSVDYVITNPPYTKLGDQFILKCKDVAKEKFALLLPLNYLHGLYRYDNIYKNQYGYCLEWVNVFVRYPYFGYDPVGKYPTGQLVFAWYIWNKNYKGFAKMRHIDNRFDIKGA
jgi:hypothetical protein